MSTIADAKRIIAAGSIEGLRLLGAGVAKPCYQGRYNLAAESALSDQQAHFTAEEREIIASFIVGEGETPPLSDDRNLNIRVAAGTKFSLRRIAAGLGIMAARGPGAGGPSISQLVDMIASGALTVERAPIVVLGETGVETGPGWDALIAEGTPLIDLAKADELAEAEALREHDRTHCPVCGKLNAECVCG